MTSEGEINLARGSMRMRLFRTQDGSTYARYWVPMIVTLLQEFFDHLDKQKEKP